MVDRSQPREFSGHLIGLHHRGIICPSEMWRQLADALTPANATGVLDSLSSETQGWLHEVFLGRPPSVYIERDPLAPEKEDYRAVAVQIVRWCEVHAPFAAMPTEPGGLIRVKVEHEKVVEWRPWEDRVQG